MYKWRILSKKKCKNGGLQKKAKWVHKYIAAEPDLKFWDGCYKNKLKYINHVIYNTTHFGVVHKKFKQNNT